MGFVPSMPFALNTVWSSEGGSSVLVSGFKSEENGTEMENGMWPDDKPKSVNQM